MRRKIAARELRRMEEQAYDNHSEAFRCVRANFDDLLKRGAGAKGGPSWESIAALLAREGQTNIHGAPLTADAVRKLFGRVRRAVALERGLPTARLASSQQPSRRAAGWRPPVIPPVRMSVPRAAASPASTTNRSTSDPDDGLTEEARAKLAALDRQFEWRDRFLHPPKRKE